MRTAIPLTVLATALICSLATTAANARARVFVASYGNDANPCTFGSPCKTFQQAVNLVDTGGEVTAIDSAGFGSVSITKSVTITSPAGVEAGIAVAANAPGVAITVGPNDAVKLRGLTILGAGIGQTGISLTSGGSLTIENCKVTDMTTSGIAMAPNANANIMVSNTLVADNGAHGLYVQPTSTANTISVVTTGVQAHHNGQQGLGFYTNNMGAGTLHVSVSDSVSANNGFAGFYALGAAIPNPLLKVQIFRSVSMGNATAGIYADTQTAIFVSQSQLGTDDWKVAGTGAICSFGDNSNLVVSLQPPGPPCPIINKS